MKTCFQSTHHPFCMVRWWPLSWVWPSCTKCRLKAIWAWSIVISITYHQLWPRKRPCELIKVGTSKRHWPQPLLPISQLQECTKSLPFTHVLHNFFFNYIWYHLNYCKNPAAKYDHLPCHSQCRMHAYLRPSIEISTVWEIKDLFSIAGIPDGFLAHNTLTMYLTLCDLPLEAAIASFGCKECYQNHFM
jgi:hypothetical protein